MIICSNIKIFAFGLIIALFIFIKTQTNQVVKFSLRAEVLNGAAKTLEQVSGSSQVSVICMRVGSWVPLRVCVCVYTRASQSIEISLKNLFQ